MKTYEMAQHISIGKNVTNNKLLYNIINNNAYKKIKARDKYDRCVVRYKWGTYVGDVSVQVNN